MEQEKIKSKFTVWGIPLEYPFVFIGFIFGLWLIFVNPPFHSADESRHFVRAYALSQGQILPNNDKHEWAGYLPGGLVHALNYWNIGWTSGEKFKRSIFDEERQLQLDRRHPVYQYWDIKGSSPIPYIPPAIGITIGSLVETQPFWLLWFGRIGALLFYLLIVFFAIRITPTFKSIIFLYALTPIMLFQGSSVTYDTMLNSVSLLMLAFVIKYSFQKENLGIKELIYFSLIVLLLRFAKSGYILLPLMFFIIPVKKIGGYPKAILMLVIFAIIYFIPNFTWGKLIEEYKIIFVGQKDVVFNSGMNLHFVLSQPFAFIRLFFANVMAQKEDWLQGIICRFGHSYLVFPVAITFFHGLVLMAVAFFDGTKKISIHWWQKTILGLIGVGTIVSILVGFYIEGSPVGGNIIFGVQGRYFCPAIIPILLILYNNSFEFKQWNKYKWLVLSIYASLMLLFTVLYINQKLYI